MSDRSFSAGQEALQRQRRRRIQKAANRASHEAQIAAMLGESLADITSLAPEEDTQPDEARTALETALPPCEESVSKEEAAQPSQTEEKHRKRRSWDIDDDDFETPEDKALAKHSTGSWLLTALNGFFIGLAIIVPGISGATISIIFKLYDRIILALSSIFKRFKRAVLWLLPLIIGAIVGVILGFFGVKYALDYIPFAIVCLFGGLMIGAFPSVHAEIKGAKKSPLRIILLCLGIIIPIVISVLSTNIIESGTGDPLAQISWWEYICMFLAGIVVAATQIIPGLSASSFLMMIGYFTALIDSISLTYWKSNPAVLLVYVCLALGFLVGLFVISKIMNALFRRARQTTFFPIVGLSIGSIICMFYNPEIFATYTAWAETGMSSASVSMGLDLGLGAALLVVGLAISLALVIFESRRAKRAQSLKETSVR